MVDAAQYLDDPHKEGVLVLGGPKGLVLVTNAADVEIELENEFDNQRRKGHNASRPKFMGIKPAEVHVSFVVMPDEEAAFWKDVVPILRAKGPKGNSPPLDILHHSANRAGIKVVILKKSKIGDVNAKDGRQVTIHLQEWSPGPKAPNPSDAKQLKKNPPVVEAINVFKNQ